MDWENAGALGEQCRRHLLIGIEVKNPGVSESGLRVREIPLLGKIHETVHQDPGPGGAGNFHRAIGRAGVDYHDIVAASRRSETARQAGFLVQR